MNCEARDSYSDSLDFRTLTVGRLKHLLRLAVTSPWRLLAKYIFSLFFPRGNLNCSFLKVISGISSYFFRFNLYSHRHCIVVQIKDSARGLTVYLKPIKKYLILPLEWLRVINIIRYHYYPITHHGMFVKSKFAIISRYWQ